MNNFDRDFEDILDRAMRCQTPEGLEQRLSKLIDDCDARERRLKNRRIRMAITAAAASVLLVMGLHFMTAPKHPADTFTDPYEAAIAAQQLLTYMSEELNKGLEQVGTIDSAFEQVQTIINNSLNQ